jgi:hypothetical protein
LAVTLPNRFVIFFSSIAYSSLTRPTSVLCI